MNLQSIYSIVQSSSYCGFRPELMEADPIDLQIGQFFRQFILFYQGL